MENIKEYLESLQQLLMDKDGLISELDIALEKQLELLSSEDADVKLLDKILKQKDRLYMKIQKIDRRVNEQLLIISKEKDMRQQYPDLTVKLEKLLDSIQRKGLEIETLERSSKSKVTRIFDKGKDHVKSFRQSKGALNQYNKNMGQGDQSGTSYFMDKKK